MGDIGLAKPLPRLRKPCLSRWTNAMADTCRCQSIGPDSQLLRLHAYSRLEGHLITVWEAPVNNIRQVLPQAGQEWTLLESHVSG